MYRASAMRAWPIETSSTPGTAEQNLPRFCRFKSWPAFTPKPISPANFALSANCFDKNVEVPEVQKLLLQQWMHVEIRVLQRLSLP